MEGPGQEQPRWYSMTPEAVAQQLQVDPAKGLSTAEAQQRLQQYGPNVLAATKKESGWQAFLRQYRDFMQIILVGAALLSLVVTREWGTTLVLVGLTVFNAILGLRGESKAEASLAALEKMMKNIARVRRDGEAVEVEAEALVPGDIVLMEAGNRVPADGRLFVAATLEIEEAALTGESVASPKETGAITRPEVSLGDRLCMAFMNTAVTRGRGEMIVTATGMGTEMGHIADLLNRTESDKTPLQKQLDTLTKLIAGLAGLAFVLMVILGLMRGDSLNTIFVSGIALAIAAIPTGLPAVVTTMYSMGTRALADLGAIVKRLPSVETLGSVSAICSDKTGTLTLNKMTAREFTIPGQNRFRVTGEGYGTQGTMELSSGIAGLQPWQKNTLSYSTEGKLLSAGGARVDLDPILLPMALCADARLDNGALIGDPTEGALIVLAEKGGISVDGAREMYPRVAEVPFDSEYKFMATFHEMQNEQGTAGGALLRQGRAGRADRPQQLVLDAGRRGAAGHRREPPAGVRGERPHGAGGRTGDGRRAPRLRSADVRSEGRPPRHGDGSHPAGHGGHRGPAAPRGQGRHRQVPQRRHPGAHDHRRPCRDRGGHRARAGHRGQGAHRRGVRGHERRPADEGAARDRRGGARGPRGQDPPGGPPAAAAEHRRHDRRRGQRRAGPQEGRHRRGDGHHGHRGLERGGRDDPDRRQLRHHRQGGGVSDGGSTRT